MLRSPVWISLLARVAFGAAAAGALVVAHAADRYDAAVQHAGRSAADLQRDTLDQPAAMLRLAGLRPGQRVLDMLAGDGYYSELASYVVGPQGHVLLLNDPSFERWSADALPARVANGRLPNVEHRVAPFDQLALGERAFDAILLIKVYHDLYWVDSDKKNWPTVPTAAVLDAIVRALKPGGVLLLVDHSAKPGTGSGAASNLHRIDEAFAQHDFTSRGLKLVAKSDALRKPEDPREQISYKPPMLGKTDRFVLVFRKP